MTLTPDEEKIIERYEKHCENTSQNVKYSVERFDILIISLSSGGIALSTSFLKDILEIHPCINIFLLKLSWAFFGCALILNLISQVTSYYANRTEIKITKNIIRQKKGKPIKGIQTKLEKTKRIFDVSTQILNAICLTSLIIGITLVSVFMFNKL